MALRVQAMEELAVSPDAMTLGLSETLQQTDRVFAF